MCYVLSSKRGVGSGEEEWWWWRWGDVPCEWLVQAWREVNEVTKGRRQAWSDPEEVYLLPLLEILNMVR